MSIPKELSLGEETFAFQCRAYALEPVRELRFAFGRKFRIRCIIGAWRKLVNTNMYLVCIAELYTGSLGAIKLSAPLSAGSALGNLPPATRGQVEGKSGIQYLVATLYVKRNLLPNPGFTNFAPNVARAW